jgi:hypothetical protein
MANKQNFTPEEWTKVLQSTMLVGIAVSAADPSGLWGTLKEAAAGSSAVTAAKSNADSSELVRAVASLAAGAIGFGVVGGTQAAEFAAGGCNKLRGCWFHL